MSKVKAFEADSIEHLENKINEWLRAELFSHNNQVNIKLISHGFTTINKAKSFNVLLVYEYI